MPLKKTMQVHDVLSLIFILQRIGTLADNICKIPQEIVFFVEGKSIRRKESHLNTFQE